MICRRFGIGDGVGKGECGENAPQDSRTRLAGWARRAMLEVLGTSYRDLFVCLALDAPLPLADFFSILRVVEVIYWMEGLS
jgi:hypothetical protein